MLRLDRADIVRDKILGVKNNAWSFESNKVFRASLRFRNGWQASIWSNPSWTASDGTATANKDSFLNECRTFSCPHTLDVWVDGLNKVLSAHWDETGAELISMRRGMWETILFGLPLPKRRSSLLYFTVEIEGELPAKASNGVRSLLKPPSRLH